MLAAAATPPRHHIKRLNFAGVYKRNRGIAPPRWPPKDWQTRHGTALRTQTKKVPPKRPRGDYFGEGFAIGITNSARRVSNAAAALANGATGALGGASVSTLNVPSLAQNDQMSAINRAVEQTLGRLNIELVVDGERLGRASIKANKPSAAQRTNDFAGDIIMININGTPVKRRRCVQLALRKYHQARYATRLAMR